VTTYKFPDRINREIKRHQKPGGGFVAVGVDLETGEVKPLIETSYKVDEPQHLHGFDCDENGANFEVFFRVTRITEIYFFVERIRWRLDRRDICGPDDETEIHTALETIKLNTGTWNAHEFSMWYAERTEHLSELSAIEYQEITNQFLNFVLSQNEQIKQAKKSIK
jgi:hypothetical protein